MRVIGIDPGSVTTGYGIVDCGRDRLRWVDSGALRASGETFPERLGDIFARLVALLRLHRPEVMAIETVFVHRNVESALKLGQARGAAVCAGVGEGIPVSEYAPSEIKRAVVGTGGADKVQVQHMVVRLLGLERVLQADEADALAVAICHGHSARGLQAQPALRRGGRRRSRR